MRTTSRSVICLFLALCFVGLGAVVRPTAALAQQEGATSLGTDFWLTFMPNYLTPANNIRIFLGSGTDNKVRVDFYGGSDQPVDSRTVTMKANTVATVFEYQTAIAEERITEQPEKKGIHVTSQNPIVVYGLSNSYATTDGYLALPTPGLGTHYFTANYYDDHYIGANDPLAGEFCIVATEDNTHVTIKTRADTRLDPSGINIGHRAGKPWSIDLLKGQTYLVQSTGLDYGNGDLTGSEITSNRPIGVVSGHQRCTIPVGFSGDSKDHLCEMLISTDRWGTQYFDAPVAYRPVAGDYIRLVSADTGCIIYENGAQVGQLDLPGDWVDRDQVLDPTVYTSNGKHFLCLEYAYSEFFAGDPDPADPFMIMMTPEEQFQKYLIFRTPDNLAGQPDYFHFATFICRDDQIRNIKVNGKKLSGFSATFRTFPNTKPVMGAAKIQLSNSSNTFVATGPSPFGMYLYGFTNVESYGWPAGMALKIISPDTLPPLQIKDSACGNYHVELLETRHKAPFGKFSFEDSRISAYALITDTGDSRWKIPSFNYQLVPDSLHTFATGDSTTFFDVRVIDPTQDAYGAVWTTDKAGNDTTYQYYYSAPKLSLSPAAPYKFDPVTVSFDSCKTLTLRNIQTTGSVRLSSAAILGLAKGGKFIVTPTKLDTLLKPNDSIKLNLCFTATDTTSSLDSLIINTECVPFHYALLGRGVTPIIIADDIDFGAVVKDQTKCASLKLHNVGNAPLVIDKKFLRAIAKQFVLSNTDIARLPIVIQPGKSDTMNFCFTPDAKGLFQTVELWSTNILPPFARQRKDTSVLLGQGVEPGLTWDRLTQGYTVECANTDTIRVNLSNPDAPNATLKHVIGLKIVGVNASEFQITDDQIHAIPVETSKLDIPVGGSVWVDVRFVPNIANGYADRHAYAVAYGDGGQSDTVAIALTGVVRHSVIRISPPVYDFGISLPGTPVTTTIWVHNDGDTTLTLGQLQVDSIFTLQYTVGTVIPAHDSIAVTVTGVVQPGPRSIGISASNGATTPCGSTSNTKINTNGQDLVLNATSLNYGDIFLCQNGVGKVSTSNDGSTKPAILESVRIKDTLTTTGASQFSFDGNVQELDPKVQVGAGQSQSFTVHYKPGVKGPGNAKVIFTYLDPAKGTTFLLVRDLTGNALFYNNTVSAQNNTKLPFVATTADDVSIPIKLTQSFETRAKIYGLSYTLRYRRNAFRFKSVTADGGLVTTSTPVEYTDPADPAKTYSYVDVKLRSANPIVTIDTTAHLNLQYLVGTDTTTFIEVQRMAFLDNTDAPVCYVAADSLPGEFLGNNRCGDLTIRKLLLGQDPFSIIKIGPNPAKGQTKVDYDVLVNGMPISIELFDVLGAKSMDIVVKHAHAVGNYSASFDASSLPSGTYTVRISNGERVHSEQIIVRK